MDFAERFCRQTRGSQAGTLYTLRDWQKRLLVDLAESGARRAYIQMPRKNGKSMLGAVLALHGLFVDGEQGAEVYSVAGSRDQARLVFDEACRMVQLDPFLSKHLTVQRYQILHKPSGSKYRVLAAEAGTAEGLNPHLVVFDEVHVLGSDRRLWDVMNLGSGAREHPLVLGITTPGVRYGTDGRDSLAWTLWDYSRRIESGEVSDPTFFSRIWEAPEGSGLWDVDAWERANPGLGDFLSVEDMEAAALTTPENEFRTKRMGQWVNAQAAWLPYGSWEACAELSQNSDGASVVLGFDGSFSGDGTALVAATIEPNPRVTLVGLWERDPQAPASWRVDHAEVEAAVLGALQRYDVRELVCDPHLWQRDMEAWAQQGVPVVEFPQTPSRMVPATQRFYEAVTTGTMRHDGNPSLARHLGNAVIRPNGQIAKEHKDSGRKIDAAVAAVMAYDRAATLERAEPWAGSVHAAPLDHPPGAAPFNAAASAPHL
ncbi:MAG: terminase large subunit [Actinomycetota bacterium]